MPVINVTFIEGADTVAQGALAEDITAATVERLNVPREAVQVVFTPIPAERWAVGGTMMNHVLGGR